MHAIGAGRIGTALQARAEALGMPFGLIDRTSGWEALDEPPGEPILVLVRTQDLPGLAARVPAPRVRDLVLVQNGMLREWLPQLGLQTCTRAELYFAVSQRAGPIVPGDVTVATGLHADVVAHWLGRLGLPARSIDWLRFTWYELEKTIWLTAFGALCDRHRLPVGRIATEHGDELRAVVAELIQVGRAANDVEAPLEWVLERLIRYSAAIADWKASVKEWDHRNGWFVRKARELGVQTPALDALHAAIEGGRT
jgi:hypothetical protein